jgi:hypothetical protein
MTAQRRTVAVAAACLIALGGVAVAMTREQRRAATPPAARSQSLAAHIRIGLIANTLDEGRRMGADQDVARRSRAGWLREEFRWYEAEPRPGVWRWHRIDRLMRAAARRGLRILPLLIGSPRWLSASEMHVPDRPAGFAAFTARVARRYGPGGTFWRARPEAERRLAPGVFEIWNEPFVPQFAAGRVSAPRYARLFRAAARAGQRANPQTRYLLAVDTTYVNAAGEMREWIPDVLRSVPDLRRWTWGLAVHPYSVTQAPSIYTPGSSRFQFLRIREVRQAWGDAPRLWLTELGWSTCPTRTECVSEADQAEYLREAFEIARRERLGVEAIFVYRMLDLGPPNPHEREHWFGLRRSDGSPKPAWFVLQRIAERGA